MMIDTFIYILIACATAAIPSKSVMALVTDTVHQTASHAVGKVIGVVSAIAALGVIAIVSIAVISAMGENVFEIAKIIGVLFLLYLSVKLVIDRPEIPRGDTAPSSGFYQHSLTSFKTTFFDTTAFFFFIALFLQYVDITAPVFLQSIPLVSIFSITAALVYTGYTYFAVTMKSILSNPRLFVRVNCILGWILTTLWMINRLIGYFQ